jgi:hypothetical protein
MVPGHSAQLHDCTSMWSAAALVQCGGLLGWGWGPGAVLCACSACSIAQHAAPEHLHLLEGCADWQLTAWNRRRGMQTASLLCTGAMLRHVATGCRDTASNLWGAMRPVPWRAAASAEGPVHVLTGA